MQPKVVVARILGTPEPGTAVWKSTDDPEIAGDIDDVERRLRADDLVVLSVVQAGFRWHVRELLDHQPADRPRRSVPRRPHAHPARPPGTVLIAWLPFTREGDDAPGKHRPCVVLHSGDPASLRVRPLYDAASAHVRRHGGVQLQGWRVAGLDKASVAVDAVEVPVRHAEQTIGRLGPLDRERLGL